MHALADTILAAFRSPDARFTLLVVVVYLLVAIVMRWYGAARPQRDHYEAERRLAVAHLHAHWWGDPAVPAPADAGARELRFRAADELLREAGKQLAPGFRPHRYLFWSGGGENAALHHIRQADRLLVAACPRDEVIARLHVVHEGLRQYGRGGAEAARDHAAYLSELLRGGHADDAPARGEPVPPPPRVEYAGHSAAAPEQAHGLANGAGEPASGGTAVHGTERLRAELEQAMQVWDDEELAIFQRRADRHNRAMWLMGIGLLLIVALAAAQKNAPLFLAGAAGGFLGRLVRVVGPANGKVDFGLASASLLLSPVVGALTGWTGVLLLSAVPLENVTAEWGATTPTVLALAVVFGFSELLFDRVAGGLEGPAGAGARRAGPAAAPAAA